MGLAFGGADLLVNCVVRDRPEHYDRQWRTLTRRDRALTAGLLYAGTHAPLHTAIVPAAQKFPSVFGGLVNLPAR